jgi:hypothetical protein
LWSFSLPRVHQSPIPTIASVGVIAFKTSVSSMPTIARPRLAELGKMDYSSRFLVFVPIPG